MGSPKGLLAALCAIEKLGRACEALFTYAKMRRDEDNGNGLYQAMTDRPWACWCASSRKRPSSARS